MKKILLFILALCLAFGLPSFASAASGEELHETDKFYLNDGDTDESNYISVVFQDAVANTRSSASSNVLTDRFSFEHELSAENARSQYDAQEAAIAQDANERVKRTVIIDRTAYEFIVSFTDSMYSAFSTKEKPDLSDYYDLSINERTQNMFLVEHYAYQQAIIQPFTATSVNNEIYLQNVSMQSDGILVVDYRVITNLATNSEGNPIFAQNERSYLAQTSEGYKLVKHWVQHIDFVNLQEDIISDVSFRTKSTNDDYAAKLLQDAEEKKVTNANLAPVQDQDFENELLELADIGVTRASTIAYDRDKVKTATYKYAVTTNNVGNPLFERIASDCTNYASQCIWQSPSWSFDTVGGSDDQKWSCTKQSNGKYYRDPPVWAGVGGLWGYAQTNDNRSYGTVHGISCTTTGYDISNVQVGDIIQLYEPGVGWHHSIVVVNVGNRSSMNSILCCAHSEDVADKSLGAYINGPTFTQYRIIHINNYIVS